MFATDRASIADHRTGIAPLVAAQQLEGGDTQARRHDRSAQFIIRADLIDVRLL
jgi:hypothetical protein